MWQWHVFALELKKLSSYRVDFWLRLVCAALVRIGLGYYLWSAIFADSNSNAGANFGGMNLAQIIHYYVCASFISNIVLSGFGTTATEIYEGTLTRYLLYPVSFFQYRVSVQLAYWLLCVFQLLLALSLLAIFDSQSYPLPGVMLLSGTLLCCFLASYLYLIMQAILEFMSFWIEGIWGLMISLYFIINFFGGGVLPVQLFPKWAVRILEYSPFPWMISFPVEVLAERVTAARFIFAISIMLGWCLLLSLIARIIWQKGLRRYSSVGI